MPRFPKPNQLCCLLEVTFNSHFWRQCTRRGQNKVTSDITTILFCCPLRQACSTHHLIIIWICFWTSLSVSQTQQKYQQIVGRQCLVPSSATYLASVALTKNCILLVSCVYINPHQYVGFSSNVGMRCIVLHYFAMHCSAMHCIVLSCIACGSPWLCISPMQWTPPALIWSSLASLHTLQLGAHHAHQLKLYTYYRKFFSRKSLGKQYVECLEWSYQGLNTTVNIVQCIAKDKERGDERIDDNIRYNPI